LEGAVRLIRSFLVVSQRYSGDVTNIKEKDRPYKSIREGTVRARGVPRQPLGAASRRSDDTGGKERGGGSSIGVQTNGTGRSKGQPTNT